MSSLETYSSPTQTLLPRTGQIKIEIRFTTKNLQVHGLRSGTLSLTRTITLPRSHPSKNIGKHTEKTTFSKKEICRRCLAEVGIAGMVLTQISHINTTRSRRRSRTQRTARTAGQRNGTRLGCVSRSSMDISKRRARGSCSMLKAIPESPIHPRSFTNSHAQPPSDSAPILGYYPSEFINRLDLPFSPHVSPACSGNTLVQYPIFRREAPYHQWQLAVNQLHESTRSVTEPRDRVLLAYDEQDHEFVPCGLVTLQPVVAGRQRRVTMCHKT